MFILCQDNGTIKIILLEPGSCEPLLLTSYLSYLRECEHVHNLPKSSKSTSVKDKPWQMLKCKHSIRCTCLHYLVRCKLWQHVTSGSNPERTKKNIDYAVHMMERKAVNNIIILIPFPCFHQSTDLGSDKIGRC